MNLVTKFVYSGLIIGLISLMFHELWVIWLDQRVFLGKFEVISETGKDEAEGTAFSRRVVAAQSLLSQQLEHYQKRSNFLGSDQTFVISNVPVAELPASAIGNLDITVQSVNVGQIFTALRKSMVSPNEITGTVTIRDGSVLAALEWPRSPGDTAKFLVPSQPTSSSAAAYAAALITWTRAPSKSVLASTSSSQFCDFSISLADLYQLSTSASTQPGLSKTEIELVRRRASQLRSHYGADTVFPEIHRLRADLLDLLPEQERTTVDLNEIQDDRLKYAMLHPSLRDLTEKNRKMAALALARPAIQLIDSKLSETPENWNFILRNKLIEISAAADAVGLIVDGEGLPIGTGFIVAPNLALSTSYIIDSAINRSADSGKTPRLCLGNSKDDCQNFLELKEIIYRSSQLGSSLALVEIKDHEPTVNPPVPLEYSRSSANKIIGKYAYAIGYPFADPRMPEEFVDYQLGSKLGFKRLMPGRILGIKSLSSETKPEVSSATNKPRVLTSDIATILGVGGAPVIDLITGKVIGINYAGIWREGRGKFSYAIEITKDILDIVSARLEDSSLVLEVASDKKS